MQVKGYIFSAGDRISQGTQGYACERIRNGKAGSRPEYSGLDDNIEYCFTVYKLPLEHRRRMKSTNMLERFNQELMRQSRVIRIFPNVSSCLRLFGCMCMEQSEEWQTGVKYLDMELLKKTKKEQRQELAKAG